MKKFIALAISIVIMATLAVPAFAATAGTTTVKYTVGETYELVVPSEIVVGGEAGKLKVTAYNLESGNKVQVSAASTTWKLGDKNYKITVGSTELTANGIAANFTAADTTGLDVTAAFVSEAPTAAGTYTDSVTFTGAIVTNS